MTKVATKTSWQIKRIFNVEHINYVKSCLVCRLIAQYVIKNIIFPTPKGAMAK